MLVLIVVENPKAWPLHLPGTEVVSAQDYLIQPRYSEVRRTKVFNLCRTYSYQTVGYYVSLLAAARGHRPLPSVATIQDLRQAPLLRIAGEDLDERLQHTFKDLRSNSFELSIYFGRNLAKRYDGLSRALFNHFPAPFLRASFKLRDRWRLESLKPIAADDIPQSHHEFVMEQATRYFDRPQGPAQKIDYRFDLAILYNPEEEDSPSNEKAIKKFMKAARSQGLRPSLIRREDYGRIAEFDGLFIRETTYVDHHTYRFARRAAAEGLVVIDDPESILRCTNKVFLAEAFAKNDVPHPRTFVVHPDNAAQVAAQVVYPCVVKKPDSAFSAGVSKAQNAQELAAHLQEVFEHSELAVVQEFVASEFDWRIGILDGRALYACRYHFPKGEWRIQSADQEGNMRYGKVETLPIDAAPSEAVKVAQRACALIGDGFYGVDIKEAQGKFVVMEVNDNPSVEAGYEDRVLKDALYAAVITTFRERMEARGLRKHP